MIPGKLCSEDLTLLGMYLFGPRWQTQLARALHRSPRLVRYWVAAQKEIPRHARERIAALLLKKHDNRVLFEQRNFLHLISVISDREMKEHLLGMGDRVSVTVDNQLRRAALGSAVTAMAAPTFNFAPHNVPPCVDCALYQAAKKQIKSATVVVVPLTPGAVPPSGSVGLVDPLEISRSTALPNGALAR